jgi:hypothetical protein
MPDWLSIHEPVLINTIGHSAGTVIFGMLLYFLLVNVRRSGEGRGMLAVAAAGLALLWNLGSLVGLAIGPGGGWVPAASFSVLSLLPAVLLHISLQARRRWLWVSGYCLGAVAVALHIADAVYRDSSLHNTGLLLVTTGFAVLTMVSVFLQLHQDNRAAGSRLAGAMALFLFAISFAHFGAAHTRLAWSKEMALHHAGLPLALLVLLQDYRFLLMDAFLRFIVNASLAAAGLLMAIRIVESRAFNGYLQDPFKAGLLFVCAGSLLSLFVWVHNRLQRLLTSAIFLRSNVDEVSRELQNLFLTTNGESAYLRCGALAIARFLHAARFELSDENPGATAPFTSPVALLDPTYGRVPSWVQAILPIHFSRGDTAYLMLGRREGGRPYLSEDLTVMARLGATLAVHIEQRRSAQLQNLVSQAELKALQAQINPHFLFNSLNTLYGTVDRRNSEARRLVLNLADVYRYLLRSERTLVEVEEELRIVRAYLEIEEIRLGSKLQTAIDTDPAALHRSIPLLSIQPLVENAVKHGVASRTGAGFVRLRIWVDAQALAVEVSNSGECDPGALTRPEGIGLANVRRRLALCYGPEARIEVRSGNGVTTVGFALPTAGLAALPAVS